MYHYISLYFFAASYFYNFNSILLSVSLWGQSSLLADATSNRWTYLNWVKVPNHWLATVFVMFSFMCTTLNKDNELVIYFSVWLWKQGWFWKWKEQMTERFNWMVGGKRKYAVILVKDSWFSLIWSISDHYPNSNLSCHSHTLRKSPAPTINVFQLVSYVSFLPPTHNTRGRPFTDFSWWHYIPPILVK